MCLYMPANAKICLYVCMCQYVPVILRQVVKMVQQKANAGLAGRTWAQLAQHGPTLAQHRPNQAALS